MWTIFCKGILASWATIALSPQVIPFSRILTCSESGGPGHWPLLTLQSEPTSHVLSSPWIHRGQLFMSTHFGRCCDAFQGLQKSGHHVDLWHIWSKVAGTLERHNNDLRWGSEIVTILAFHSRPWSLGHYDSPILLVCLRAIRNV